MAERFSYYCCANTGNKVFEVLDDGVALTDGSSVAITAPYFAATDSNGDIIVVRTTVGQTQLKKIAKSTFTLTTIAGGDEIVIGALSGIPTKLVIKSGYAWVSYPYSPNVSGNMAVCNLSTGSVNYLNVGGASRNIRSFDISPDGSEMYIATSYILDDETVKMVYRYSTTTFQQVGDPFGNTPASNYDNGNDILTLPNGQVLLTNDFTVNSYFSLFDVGGATADYESVQVKNNGFVHLDGVKVATTYVSANTLRILDYTDASTLNSWNGMAVGLLHVTKNRNNQIVCCSQNAGDADGDTANVRVFDDDLTNKRFISGGGGAQTWSVYADNTPGGVIDSDTVPTASTGGDSRTVRKLVTFGTDSSDNGECWYEDSAGSLVELSGSNGGFAPTSLMTAAEAYQKVFVANDSNLRVADFTNTKIVDANGFTNVPDKGDLIAQGAVTGVVDYVNSSGNTMYVKPTSGTFVITTAITNTTEGGIQIFPSPDSVDAPPNWYTWGAMAGSLPNRASLVCNYRGRLVLAGNPEYPHQWYMSRQADPWDWLYAVNDAQAPVAGSNADAGELGDVITCLAPNKDDYCIFGCVNTIWVMRGDPAAGGSLDEVSLSTGIIGPFAYCWDAQDNFYFFGSHGISRIPPNFAGVENLSIMVLPNLSKDAGINPTTHRVCMGYDREREGVLTIITKLSDGTHESYWYDLRTQGFFPETYGFNPAPLSCFFYESATPANRALLLGGADGYIRQFDDDDKNDDAGAAGDVAISSYATIGPLQIGKDADRWGRMKAISFTTSTDTDGLTYDIHVANTAEEVVDDSISGATPLHTGTISAGNRVKTTRARSRGAWLGVKLENTTASESWQFEKLVADIKPAGDIK
jgi:hypothetical protein